MISKIAIIPVLLLACLALQAPSLAGAGDEGGTGSQNIAWVRAGASTEETGVHQAVIGKAASSSALPERASVGSSAPTGAASGAAALSELVMARSATSTISPLTVGTSENIRTKDLTSAPAATLGTGSSIGNGNSAMQKSVSFSSASSGSGSLNATGTWSIQLRDYLERSLNLSLIQIEDVVTGYGSLEAGESSQDVTASGSVSGGVLDLFVSADGGLAVYRMTLASTGRTLSGEYQAYSIDGAVWSGTANDNTEDTSGSLAVGKIQKDPSPSLMKLGQGQNSSAAPISMREAGSVSSAASTDQLFADPGESGDTVTTTPTGGRKITRNENIVASESGAVTSTSNDDTLNAVGAFDSGEGVPKDSEGVPRPAY